MISVTFDTNLLIDLEQNREGYEIVREIVDMADSGDIELCLPSIIASERQPDGSYPSNFSVFEELLERIGIRTYTELMPLVYFDIGFLDHGLLCDDEMITLDHTIHKILFPNSEPEYTDYINSKNIDSKETEPKWRNSKLDTSMLCCHIHHKKDIFITKDKNFKNKLETLNKQIGNIEIMEPGQFVEYLRSKATNP